MYCLAKVLQIFSSCSHCMHCLTTPLMGQSYLRLESIHDVGCEMNRIKGSPLCFFSFASLWLVIWTNKREDNLLREACIPLSATVRRSKSSQLQRVCASEREREGERRWGEEWKRENNSCRMIRFVISSEIMMQIDVKWQNLYHLKQHIFLFSLI